MAYAEFDKKEAEKAKGNDSKIVVILSETCMHCQPSVCWCRKDTVIKSNKEKSVTTN